MKNQKICIVGAGLAGLSTTLTLKNLNLDIDVFYKKDSTSSQDVRTTAISETNFQFLCKQMKFKKELFWACKKVNLFYENKNKKVNFLNYAGIKKNLMYIFENNKVKSYILRDLKKLKNIKFINKKIISIDHKDTSICLNNKKYYYDLIILCLGSNSKIYQNFIEKRNIFKNYNEIAITGVIQHNSHVDNPSQYFLNNGPLAILPFKKNKFSFVWSVKKDFYLKNKENLKNLIQYKIKEIFTIKKYSIKNLQTFPINLNLKTQYFKNNILAFGEGIHSIHPVAGQGFNLVIRDIKKLNELISNNLNLGLQISNSSVLKNFYDSRSAENNIFGMGVDLTHSFFKNKKFMNPIKNIILNNIGNNKLVKKLSSLISDKGLINY